jgi:toxin HigB-1
METQILFFWVVYSMDCMLYYVMIQSFRNQVSEDLFNGRNTKAARKGCPEFLWNVLSRKLDQLDSAESLQDLRVPPGNRLEPLSGTREGQYSIRVNEQYRVCFRWTEAGPSEVEVIDYHS